MGGSACSSPARPGIEILADHAAELAERIPRSQGRLERGPGARQTRRGLRPRWDVNGTTARPPGDPGAAGRGSDRDKDEKRATSGLSRGPIPRREAQRIPTGRARDPREATARRRAKKLAGDQRERHSRAAGIAAPTNVAACMLEERWESSRRVVDATCERCTRAR